MAVADGKIPVGFSGNDFFYKSVTAPIQIDSNFCDLSENELRNKITEYYNDLSLNVPGKQPTKIEVTSYDNKSLTFTDNGVTNLPKYPDGKNELIEQTIIYYKLVCENKRLGTELNKFLSSNLDGDIKLQDTNTNYNREYLNRINLGIGIMITCGFIYYCVTAKPGSLLPEVKLPEVKLPEVKLPEVKLPPTQK